MSDRLYADRFPPEGEIGSISLIYPREEGVAFLAFANPFWAEWLWSETDAAANVFCTAQISPFDWSVAEYGAGDANKDGHFDGIDLIIVFEAGEYDDGIDQNSTWSTGDWTGDREFDSSDLVAGLTRGYEWGRAVNVPEPSAALLLLPGLIVIRCRRRRVSNSY